MDAKYIFTLVHGTKPFGTLQRTPDWIADNSAFSNALKNHFRENGGAQTFPFEWTGWNQVGARTAASEKLCEEMTERLDRFPEAQHYLICHSHGGNVAMHALLDEHLTNRIQGVACLATPFLSARPRELGSAGSDVAVGAIVTCFVAAILFLTLYGSPVLGVALGCLLGGAGVVAWKYWRGKIKEIEGELKQAPPPGRLLIVRSPADEASLFLSFFQFVSWLTVKLFVVAQGGYAWIEAATIRAQRHKWRIAGVALAAIVSMVGSIVVHDRYQLSSPAIAQAGTYGFIASFILFGFSVYLLIPRIGRDIATFPFRLLVMSLSLPVIVLLSLILLVPFGLKVAVGNLFLEISAECTPPGEWLVHLIEPPPQDEASTSRAVPLRHGVYDNPAVQSVVFKWAQTLGQSHFAERA